MIHGTNIWYAITDFDAYHEQQNYLQRLKLSPTAVLSNNDCEHAATYETLDKGKTSNVDGTLEGICKFSFNYNFRILWGSKILINNSEK